MVALALRNQPCIDQNSVEPGETFAIDLYMRQWLIWKPRDAWVLAQKSAFSLAKKIGRSEGRS